MTPESRLRFATHHTKPLVSLTLLGEDISIVRAWFERDEAIDALESLTQAVADLRRREQ